LTVKSLKTELVRIQSNGLTNKQTNKQTILLTNKKTKSHERKII
jgi:hypothetical protein